MLVAESFKIAKTRIVLSGLEPTIFRQTAKRHRKGPLTLFLGPVHFKGALSRGFSRFLAQTNLKLVVPNLQSTQNIMFEHLKVDITLTCKEKTNHSH